MENTLHISHDYISEKDRNNKFGLKQIVLLFGLVLIISLLKTRNFGASFFIVFIIFLFGFIYHKLWFQSKFSDIYLREVQSNGAEIRLTYLEGELEKKLTENLENVEIKIVNTSSRSGFSCYLSIITDSLEFNIDNSISWTLLEIKEIFIFTKKSKKNQLSFNEEVLLTAINEQLKLPLTKTIEEIKWINKM
ncbi:hypothetical protein [Lacihabitans soyangensis]|uniref:Uncharacterized protein n=1 Tax=Lacihabitans soyangensis TaxID=869394 RepID=A0AAE3H746_9BACT|nr:hypothetical protein [Lacihabitans soyangensis]MCP9766112.1 hypothetical protein [Lacihabitans soyangensis]